MRSPRPRRASAKRWLSRLSLLLAAALPAGTALAAPIDATVPLSLARFVDGIGINTHLNYSDSDYNRFQDVMAALRYIGVRHLRDAAPFAGHPNQGNLDRAADAGLVFDFVTSRIATIPATLDAIAAFKTRHPYGVGAIEGLNEITNISGFTYAGRAGAAGGVAYQNELYAAVNARPLLASIPVFSTTGPPLQAGLDFLNVHPYPGDGAQPYTRLVREMGQYIAAVPGKPIVITEGGYHTAVGKVGGVAGVDEPTQARLILTYLFDATLLGSRRTYLYQLTDGYADPTGINMEKHFGLFDHNFRAKPAAVALHNLMVALRNSGGATTNAATESLVVKVASPDPEVASLQVARPDGARAVILYRRTKLWDVYAKKPVVPRLSGARITAPGFSRIAIFAPVTATEATSQTGFAGSAEIPLGCDPVVAILYPG